MNVEIGAEAALFPDKEYKNGIAVAVHTNLVCVRRVLHHEKIYNFFLENAMFIMRNMMP